MKVITEETISTVTASSEDLAYPVENVLNRHPKKAWKALPTVNSASLNITINGDITDIGIVGTNATSIRAAAPEVTALGWERDGVAMIIEDSSGTIAWEGAYMVVTSVKLVDTDTGDIWLEVSEIPSSSEFTLLFEAEVGETVQVGVVSGGLAVEFPNPNYGISEDLIDYSIEKETSNGGHYYRKRNIIRKYGMQLQLLRDTEAITMMRTIGIGKGGNPLMWRLTDLEHSQWVVYGRARISQTHDTWHENNVNLELTEAV